MFYVNGEVMESGTFVVKNRLGLHARAAALIVKEAHKYQAETRIRKGSNEVDAKSIMGLLTLAAEQGSRLTVSAEGAEATKVVKSLGKIIESDIDGGGEE